MENAQTIAALLIVGIAATLLIISSIRKRKKPGCAAGCGCSVDTFKKQLKH